MIRERRIGSASTATRRWIPRRSAGSRSRSSLTSVTASAGKVGDAASPAAGRVAAAGGDRQARGGRSNMNERVREILACYASDSPGTRTNLARLLNHGRLGGTGRLVILPVDQGFEHGPARSFAPNPAGYDPTYHFQLAIEAGCNAYAAPLGFLEAGVAEFAGDIPLILKMNNHDVLNDEKDPLSVVTAAVKDALRLGCVAAGFTIYPASAQARANSQRW